MLADCTAIIMAGGASRRMGSDKATLPFAGKTLLESVIASLQPLFLQTVVSVSQPRPEIDLPQICDKLPHAGPLAGLATALEQISTPWAFMVACDMPFVSPALIQHLAQYRGTQQAIVPVVHGQLQPLAAFYSIRSIPVLRASLSLGERSLIGAIRNLDVSYIDETEILRIDPQLRSFFDLDTPQDLAQASGHL